jgi:hypothetical protein
MDQYAFADHSCSVAAAARRMWHVGSTKEACTTTTTTNCDVQASVRLVEDERVVKSSVDASTKGQCGCCRAAASCFIHCCLQCTW